MSKRMNPTESNKALGRHQRGATALFVVIFSAILLSLIAISFTTLMLREQGRSTDDEQSQGAYDAALAGVEDGKRVLEECLRSSNPSSSAACLAINSGQCDTVPRAGIAGSVTDPEVMVQSSSAPGSGDALNIAYTCVVVQQNTEFYRRTLDAHDSSVIVKLQATAPYDTVTVEWYTEEDSTDSQPANVASTLPALADWPPNYPPIIRAQLMQFPDNNMSAAGLFNDRPYAMTKYLYPKTVGANSSPFDDPRRSAPSSSLLVSPVICQTGFNLATGYSCSYNLTLPIGGALTKANRTAYLRLTTLYEKASIRLSLSDSASPATNVLFQNVQPTIDATGRANDLFRRVSASVEITDTEFPFPRATVDITNNFCKNMFVTDRTADYRDGRTTGDCDPSGP